MNYLPLIIIGAPRSGTNMLRDVLTQLPSFATWPCDEINYIWRHGNVQYPTDEFTVAMARPAVKQYIRKQFDWVANRYQADVVVEKTCANSLRVEFVKQVVPEARYIFIRRDGLDAIGSAMQRWHAQLDLPYILKKARFVPISDLPYYGSRYLWNRMYRLISRRKRLAFWGPQFDGMTESLGQYSLEEVCALQWQKCVENSASALAKLPETQWVEVSYENLVQTPQVELERILQALQIPIEKEDLNIATQSITNKSVGKGRKKLSEPVHQKLEVLIGDTLHKYGYA